MPLRILKHDIAILTKLRAIAYLIEFVQYVVEKHPNISSEFVEYYAMKKCPKCQSELKRVHHLPDYYMCFKCIKGYTNEELNNASLQQEDNPTDEL